MNISEIARRAGVSPSAVSRYLNNGYLSEQKRAAIQKVIEETGYRPMAQAQALRTRKTRTIGVILPRIDSFAVSSVTTGIASVLEENGFQLLLADTRNTPQKELDYLDAFDEQRVDGVILIATVLSDAHTNALKNRRTPTVLIGQRLAGVSCVYHDDYNAFYDVTRLVISKGCKKLGYIGAMDQDRAVGQDRRRAFCDAVREAGLSGQENHTVVSGFSIRSGREMAEVLLDAWGPLDAVVCATDAMAVGTLQCLKSRGIQVPQQALLTGHGHSDVASVTTPPITTIRYYYEESGADGANLLLDQIRHPDAPVKEIRLGYCLVERESTRR